MTKFGTAKPNAAPAITSRSIQEFCRTAASRPAGMPSASLSSKAGTAISNVGIT